ncbi:MAG: hypothetical protein U0271_35270 [Polyangiaceae bacterium]
MRDPVLASRVFGVYLGMSGLGFFGAPGMVVPMLGLPAPSEFWVRIVGLLTVILSMYFLYCARPGERRFFQATVIARCMFFTGVTALVLAGVAPKLLVLFGLVDLAGAAWTQLALRATLANAARAVE